MLRRYINIIIGVVMGVLMITIKKKCPNIHKSLFRYPSYHRRYLWAVPYGFYITSQFRKLFDLFYK
jgi:hypothetical protein